MYWDGQQFAYRAWDGTTYFDQTDFLGTERMRTKYTGAVAATFTSLPFGDASTATIGGSVNQYLYDGESKLCAVRNTLLNSMTEYLYDPEGNRVAKGTPNAFNCNFASNGFAATSRYVIGLDGEQLSEITGAGAWSHTNVFGPNGLLATYSGSSVYFALNNWLGTKRLTVDENGLNGTKYNSFPFGNAQYTGGSFDPSELHFTGKERDAESGLDYFGARYYGSTMGRFLSPDPQTPTPLHLLNPQRWNMYGYGLNNPLSYTDSGGRDAAAVNFSKEIAIVGHEGIMSVHSDGTVTYARFGPAGGSSPTGPGQVQSFTLSTKVQFDSNGQPTTDSLNAVKNELATSGPEKGQDPSSIRLNYFKTTDEETANLDQWIQQQQDASNRGQSPRYNVLTNNCTMFCQRGLVAGSAMSQSQADKSSIVPNFFWYQLSQEPKATVTSSECDSLPDGSTRCQ